MATLTLPQTLSGTPRYLETLSRTLRRGTSGPKGPKTLVGGRRVLKGQAYTSESPRKPQRDFGLGLQKPRPSTE